MASKRSKNAATDEIDELFEGIGGTEKTAPPKKTAASKAKAKAKAAAAEKDILAELESELDESKPLTSRPHTPRIRDTGAGGAGAGAGAVPSALPHRSLESSKLSSARTSEDHPTPGTSESAAASAPSNVGDDNGNGSGGGGSGGGGGGWWGGFLSTAMKQAEAAVKQAEAAVKEIKQNEEAKKWADQVRGNVSALRGYGDDLAHRALLPTFTNILHTLAPPIASHERLLIHITHDMVGYPSMDPLVHGVFSRVMAQVEGGDLLVIQRGQESSLAAGAETDGHATVSAAGWHDGPWWRVVDSPRDLGVVPGLHEGSKLCRASAEAYANEYYAAHYGADVVPAGATNADKAKAGLEVARQRAVDPVSESNPVRRSDLFLAVQAISTAAAENNLFAASAASAKEKEDAGATDKADEADDLVSFAVYILDPVHDIVHHTISQAVPAKWVRWLDTPAASVAAAGGDAVEEEEEEEEEEESEDEESEEDSEEDSEESDDSDDSEDSEDSDAEEKKKKTAAKTAKVADKAKVAAQKVQQKAARKADKAARKEQAKAARAAEAPYASIPEDIRPIVESGGVDPREWVAEWIEEALTLAVGVVAQRYVARRMGVGEGSAVKGKRRMDTVLEAGGGEVARAGLI